MKLFCFLVVMLLGSTASANPSKHMLQEMRKAVFVFVQNFSGQGMGLGATAFPLDKDSLLTAGHFCEDAKGGARKLSYGDRVYMRYLNINDELTTTSGGSISRFKNNHNVDLCIINFPNHGMELMTLNAKEDARFGDKVFIVGGPLGIFPMITEGYVGQTNSSGSPNPFTNGKLLVSGIIGKGNSGGPVLNERGEVIGVIVMVNTTYNHIAYAVPLKRIKDFLSQQP